MDLYSHQNLKLEEHVMAHPGKDPIVYGKALGFFNPVTSSTRTYYTHTAIDSDITGLTILTLPVILTSLDLQSSHCQ